MTQEEVPSIRLDEAFDKIADPGGNLDPSLRRVLAGFYKGMGGPEKVGEALADIASSKHNRDDTRLKAIDSALRLTRRHVPEEEESFPDDLDGIEKELAELTRKH